MKNQLLTILRCASIHVHAQIRFDGNFPSKNLMWISYDHHKIQELNKIKIAGVIDERDAICKQIYRKHPFKTSLKANEVLEEILSIKYFID